MRPSLLIVGEFVGIIGPNGSGKTTLLKPLRGLYPASGGQVFMGW